MRKVILFIAMSLDGYITDQDGRVDWLEGQEQDGEMVDVYSEFAKSVDTVLMGWNTYNQIVMELSPEDWVYKGMTSYVFTHRNVESNEEIVFCKESPCVMVKKLKQEKGKNIWICGGAGVVEQLMGQKQIDEYYISVLPVLLGSGVRLFKNEYEKEKLRLIGTQSYNGIVDLHYVRR